MVGTSNRSDPGMAIDYSMSHYVTGMGFIYKMFRHISTIFPFFQVFKAEVAMEAPIKPKKFANCDLPTAESWVEPSLGFKHMV